MTLTYVYADSTAVIGPLATYAEPHAYDLCEQHATRLTAPRGWDVVRLAIDAPAPATHDDLVALAEAVRRSSRPRRAPGPETAPRALPSEDSERSAPRSLPEPDSVHETGRRGHLRVLRDRG